MPLGLYLFSQTPVCYIICIASLRSLNSKLVKKISLHWAPFVISLEVLIILVFGI